MTYDDWKATDPHDADEADRPLDPESACMHDGCELEATRFEKVPGHWHDNIWCADHAKGRVTVPLYPNREG